MTLCTRAARGGEPGDRKQSAVLEKLWGAGTAAAPRGHFTRNTNALIYRRGPRPSMCSLGGEGV